MIPLSISEKLLRLAGGERIPASELRHEIIRALIREDIITETIAGRTKKTLFITDAAALDNWLHNKHSINSLWEYINTLKKESASRADLVKASNDSKTKSVRSFKGFLVNCYHPVACMLHGTSYTVYPAPGTFHFVYDFESFIPPADTVIIGVENAENFRHIEKQQYLFKEVKALFVCRYPQGQSNDLMEWLRSVPNPYLHFGDLDFAGINIYLQEYKKHLGTRATFFIPENTETLLIKYGNRKLYDQQKLNAVAITEDGLQKIIALLHKYKAGLEQEALLIERNII